MTIAALSGHPSARPKRSALIAGAIVFVLGFGVLALIWSLGSWRDDVPGLFDYRSATIGYGLLLPLAVALLVAGRERLASDQARIDRRWLALAALAGATAAAAVQAAWLLDPSPEPNWSFPRPHHFNLGGVWNALSTVVISGLIAGLICDCVRLVRGHRRSGSDLTQLVSQQGLGLLVACLVGLAGLIALDNERAAATDAGLATVTAVAVGAGVTLVILSFAFAGQLSRFFAALLWGLSAAAGLSALSAVGIEARFEIAVALVVTALLTGLAVSQPFSARAQSGFRWMPITAAALVIAGAGSQAISLVDDQGSAAAAWVVGGAALAVFVGTYGLRFDLAVFLRGSAIVFCLGTLTWTAWINDKADPAKADNAYNAVALLFEILVLVLIRNRVKELVKGEEEAAANEPGATAVGTTQPPPGWAAWIQFVGFGVPAVVTAVIFLVVAGPLLGANDVAQGSAATIGGLALAGLCAAAVALIGAAIARRRRAPQRDLGSIDVDLPVPSVAAVLSALGATAVAAVMALGLAGESLRLELIAALLALIYGALCLEDLRATPARLQLMELGRRGWLVAVTAALAQALTLYWLLTVGMWHDGAPADVLSMVGNIAIALLVGYLIHAGAGLTLAWSLPGQALTPEPADVNVLGIGLLYVGLALLGAVAPAFVVGRVEAARDLADSGTVVLGTVFIVPSCCFAVYWILKENFEHVKRQRKNLPPPSLRALFPGDEAAAIDANEVRVNRQANHAAWQFRLSVAMVASGLAYAAAVSI